MATGFLEMLIVILMGGGLAPMGLPPGGADPKLAQVAPQEPAIYMEWSSMGEGVPGGEGTEGFFGDPEVRQFIASTKNAIINSILEETQDEEIVQKTMGKHIPALIIEVVQRPGCLFADFDAGSVEKMKALSDGRPEPEVFLLSTTGTLVVSGGERADAIAGHLEALINLLPPEAKSETPLDRQMLPVPSPDPEGPQAFVHREGDYFIVTWGRDTLEPVITALKEGGTGITGNKRYQSALGKISLEKTSRVTWVDLVRGKGIAKEVLTEMGAGEQAAAMVDGTLQMLGLAGLDHAVFSSGVEGGQFTQRAYLGTGGETTGVLSLAAGRALQPSDFAHVPADADMVYALSLNLQTALEQGKQVVAAADPPTLEKIESDLSILEKEFGLDLDEVFAAFGEVWTIQNAPSTGGMLFSQPVLALEVKDPQKAYAVFSDLMKLLRDALPGDNSTEYRKRGIYLANRKFMDRTIYFVNPIGQNDNMPFSFSFCVTDTHFYVTSHVQTMKAQLRWLDEQSNAEDAKSFADGLQSEFDDEVIGYAHTEPEAALRVGYAFLPWFASMIYGELQQEGIELQPIEFPSARGILPYVKEGKSIIQRTEGGVFLESQASFPIPGAAASAMQFFGFAAYSLTRLF